MIIQLKPFLPTGQFLAPKLIILNKCLIDIVFLQSVVLVFLFVEQDVWTWYSNHVQVLKI